MVPRKNTCQPSPFSLKELPRPTESTIAAAEELPNKPINVYLDGTCIFTIIEAEY